MSGTPIRIVVKSRRRLVRDGICAYVAGWPAFTVVGQAASIAALPELCALQRPDAALIDTLELDVPTVAELRQVRTAAPRAEIAVTYAAAAPEAVSAAIDAGITALVPCSRGLGAVLHRVMKSAQPAGRQRPDGAALTEYDLRIMALMSAGYSSPEMADLLHVSRRVVENHKRRLYSKLAVGNSCQAVSKATALGLVDSVEAGSSTRHEPDGSSPFVVHGAPGPAVERVLQALRAAGAPFLHISTLVTDMQRPWAHSQREHAIAVLVDPTRDDWLAAAAIKARPVVVLSGGPDLPAIVDMLMRGARAVVHGDDVPAHLAAVLSVVGHGYVAVDAAHIEGAAGWLATRLTAGQSAIPALTARESDVLRLIASGATIRQTATALGIAAKTVENTQSRLYRKLGARNRAGALMIAYRLGLVEQHALGSEAIALDQGK